MYRKKGAVFFIEECYLVNVKKITKLGKHHFAATILKIDSGRYH